MENTQNKPEGKEKIKVGLVMPISDVPEFPKGHWEEVRGILRTILLEEPNYEIELEMVSFSKDANIIQGNIVTNLRDLELVICDISNHNPNVMLELGMRLIFDKPVIIIKDSETKHPFDISPLVYLTYPSNLNYPEMIEFKKDLLGKTYHTIAEYRKDKNYSQFLKNFGKFEQKNLKEQSSIIDIMNGNIINILGALNKMQEMIKNERFKSTTEQSTYVPINPYLISSGMGLDLTANPMLGGYDISKALLTSKESKSITIGDSASKK